MADYYATLEAAGTPDPLATLRGAVGTQLDGACCEALEASLRGVPLDPRPAVRQVLLDRLTDREVEVLQLLARGLSNPQIADNLVISKKTVEHHLEHIYDKIGVSTRTSAVAYALHHLKLSIQVG